MSKKKVLTLFWFGVPRLILAPPPSPQFLKSRTATVY